MRISDWSSDVCSSDLLKLTRPTINTCVALQSVYILNTYQYSSKTYKASAAQERYNASFILSPPGYTPVTAPVMQEISLKRNRPATVAAPANPSALLVPTEPQAPARLLIPEEPEHPPTNTRKLFIRTFGCQMNEYDSDKMADVLREDQGVEITQDPEEADIILFTTCSVREKAQEKVFSDLGRIQPLTDRKGVVKGRSVAGL